MRLPKDPVSKLIRHMMVEEKYRDEEWNADVFLLAVEAEPLLQGEVRDVVTGMIDSCLMHWVPVQIGFDSAGNPYYSPREIAEVFQITREFAEDVARLLSERQSKVH